LKGGGVFFSIDKEREKAAKYASNSGIGMILMKKVQNRGFITLS